MVELLNWSKSCACILYEHGGYITTSASCLSAMMKRRKMTIPMMFIEGFIEGFMMKRRKRTMLTMFIEGSAAL